MRIYMHKCLVKNFINRVGRAISRKQHRSDDANVNRINDVVRWLAHLSNFQSWVIGFWKAYCSIQIASTFAKSTRFEIQLLFIIFVDIRSISRLRENLQLTRNAVSLKRSAHNGNVSMSDQTRALSLVSVLPVSYNLSVARSRSSGRSSRSSNSTDMLSGACVRPDSGINSKV